MDEYTFYGIILALSNEVDHEVLPMGLKEFLKDFESGINEVKGLRESIQKTYASEILDATNHSTTIH